MGLFGKWKDKQDDKTVETKSEGKELLEIGLCISRGNDTVIKDMQNCISNTIAYLKEHQSQYEERGIEEEDIEDEEFIRWIGLADCLINHGYICELDWNSEKNEFIHFLNSLSGMQFYNLTLEKDWFEEDAYVAEWCDVLDEKWKTKEVCMAALDINSDSYLIFPISIADFKNIKETANKIGHRIALAKDM